ncbi:MAG: aromatic ring-hydroxylating dioxygenase subunit alpha [Pseudomonadota bacterium]
MNVPAIKIQPGDRPFCANPAESFTMPARFYNSAKIYEAEKEAIFYRNWYYVCHQNQLRETGQFVTANIHEQSVFVTRDRKGVLQAFYNVCAHRGHELVQGSGKKNLIVCPYHAWSFDLDGTLKAARNSENILNFDKCEFSLKPVQVEVFCGFVFINLDEDAKSLSEQAPELEEEIRKYCPKIDDLVFAQRDSYSVKCNWKVMIDNFLECYHCDPAHRDFVDLVDMDTYRSHCNGIYSSHVSENVRTTNASAFSFEKGNIDFGYCGWFLWPNLTIWAYPGETNISVLQMIPDGLGNTIEYQDWFIESETPSPQLKEAMDYQKDVLQPEDISLCESVQKGLQSKGYNQGRFVVDAELSELSEHAVHHFQKMVMESLGGDIV